jgi:Pectinesterase
MKTTLISLRVLFFALVVGLLGQGCSSSDPGPTPINIAGAGAVSGSAGNSSAGRAGAAGTGTGGANAGTGGSANAGSGGTGGAAGSAGSGGSAGTPSGPFVYFIKQAASATNTAALANGTISVANMFGASGNGFKYVAPNYYGTVSNGFIAFPTPMTGDFSISAEVTVTAQNKANNACGIGLGITTGFDGTDSYAYVLMRNMNNTTNGYYVSGAGVTSAGAPSVAFTTGTPLALSFSRTGTNLTYGAGPVGSALTTTTSATSNFTNGTTAYGGGAVYPAISFNNVNATITKLLIKDATGATVFDSATGALVNYIPAALTLSSSAVSITKGNSSQVTVTASAAGGAISTITAVSADPTIATATVASGATNSTITLAGLKGGVTTVTVTNTGDPNPTTKTKTITVSVNDYPVTDGYGSLATRAYPVPAATTAYTDGELALTFDAPPTLNTGGSIKIFKQSDGTEVDSVAFANETQTFGTTVINVGSQLARVATNTLYFTPHLGKLSYGTGYYVVIPTTSVTGTLNSVAFNGLSNLSTVATWKFTTRAAPTLSATSVTVDGAQTSTANFRTIQGALGAITTGLPTATAVTINVAAGTYRELLRFVGPGAATPITVNIIGPAGNNRGDTCVVQYTNGNGLNGSTATRASAYLSGANFVLQNITLKNTAVRATLAQSEALYFANGIGLSLAAFNSSFSGNQDTIQTSGRSWFYKCYVEGNVDFIWGTGDAALFENSSLHFINDAGAGGGTYSLFVARTGTTIAAGASGTVGKGYVLLNSTVSVDANVTAYFGRDAGVGAFYDQVALVNVAFSGAGTIATGMWNIATAPLVLGDSSYVGWKSAGVTGLNAATLSTAAGTSSTIASQAAEYDTRDHILNRVVTVTAGVPAGYQAAATSWNVSALATAWGAP